MSLVKTLLLAIALGATSAVAHAQGTIAFGNAALTRFHVRLADGTERLATAEDNLLIGAFYGPAYSTTDSLVLAPGLAMIGPADGVMVNAPSVFPLPGTHPEQDITLQIRAWDAALGPDGWQQGRDNCAGRYYGETHALQFTLGLTTGPGVVIWARDSTGANRFDPLSVAICPEPSTLGLGTLGGLGWLVFLRRRK